MDVILRDIPAEVAPVMGDWLADLLAGAHTLPVRRRGFTLISDVCIDGVLVGHIHVRRSSNRTIVARFTPTPTTEAPDATS